MARLDGDGVVFADGSREQIDAIVWATGYNVTFPFLRQPELTPQDNAFALFKRMVKPGFENLFFLGLAQPLPTLVNFAEQQSKLVAAAIAGRYEFPSAREMVEITAADEKLHRRRACGRLTRPLRFCVTHSNDGAIERRPTR